MTYSLFLLVFGLLSLFIGAEALVRGSSALALSFRIRPLVIGLTVVAFGTSAPELAVSINSALAGRGDIAAGNVIGSNIFNIAAILGLSALIFPLTINLRLVRYEIPMLLMITLIALWLMGNQSFSRIEGMTLFVAFIGYTAFTFILSKRESSKFDAEAGSELPATSISIPMSIGMIVIGLTGLVFGADWFVRGAVDIARKLELSDAVIGLTIVAAGTSLPELATSLVAAFRRHTDIAVGNVIGSNIFNILAILGITGIIKPFSTLTILPVDGWSMLIIAVMLFPLARTGFTLKRWEGGLLLAAYIGYVVYRINLN